MGSTVSTIGNSIAKAAKGTLHIAKEAAEGVAHVGSVVVQAALPHVMDHFVSKAIDGIGELTGVPTEMIASALGADGPDLESKKQFKVIYPRRLGESNEAMISRVLAEPQYASWHQIELRDPQERTLAVIRRKQK